MSFTIHFFDRWLSSMDQSGLHTTYGRSSVCGVCVCASVQVHIRQNESSACASERLRPARPTAEPWNIYKQCSIYRFLERSIVANTLQLYPKLFSAVLVQKEVELFSHRLRFGLSKTRFPCWKDWEHLRAVQRWPLWLAKSLRPSWRTSLKKLWAMQVDRRGKNKKLPGCAMHVSFNMSLWLNLPMIHVCCFRCLHWDLFGLQPRTRGHSPNVKWGNETQASSNIFKPLLQI